VTDAVPAVERGQQVRAERLDADADPVDPVVGEDGDPVGVEALGVGLDGEFRTRRS
jgi:hypothetical protein